MRYIYLITVITILYSFISLAQIPRTISYQGVLNDESGNSINGSHDLTLKLYDVETGGNILWQENHNLSISNGIFNVILGNKNPLNIPFDKPYWLGVSIDSGTELQPRTPLTSSPYSLNATNAYWTKNDTNIFYNQGFVGIGNDDPDFSLDIHSKQNAFTRYTTDESGKDNTNDGFLIGYTNNQAWLKNGENTPIVFFTHDSPRMTIEGDGKIAIPGKVGIRTNNPTHELHLKHSTAADGGASAGLKIENLGDNHNWWSLYTANGSGQFELYYKGTIKGKFMPDDGAYVQGSDRKLKRDIEPISTVMEKVMQLKPSTYYFKDAQTTSSPSLGFIAQEVQPFFPELVSYAGEEQKIMTLNYTGFSVIAIKAIQEQQKTIENLLQRIEELERTK